MMLILFVGITALAWAWVVHERWWSLLLALVAGFSFGELAAYLQVVDVLGRVR